VAGLVAAVVLVLASLRASRADDDLQTIRDDVRDPPPPSSPSAPKRNYSGGNDGQCDDAVGSLFAPLAAPAVMGAGMAVTSPIWGPITVLDDSYSEPGYFPHFPYEDSPGYITRDDSNSCLWAARLDVEYANNFDGLDSLGGHFLLDTTYRFGLEASGSQLDQRLAGGGHDRLAIGDANLVFRFAQAPWAEFRAGLGANWLADRQETNFGFNFTYAADFFPRNPWVVSSTIDAGMLGYSGLFRFRLTGGVIFHGVEAYTGFENLDIGRTHLNSLVGGLRFWF
jgi:hypothetical protein